MRVLHSQVCSAVVVSRSRSKCTDVVVFIGWTEWIGWNNFQSRGDGCTCASCSEFSCSNICRSTSLCHKTLTADVRFVAPSLELCCWTTVKEQQFMVTHAKLRPWSLASKAAHVFWKIGWHGYWRNKKVQLFCSSAVGVVITYCATRGACYFHFASRTRTGSNTLMQRMPTVIFRSKSNKSWQFQQDKIKSGFDQFKSRGEINIVALVFGSRSLLPLFRAPTAPWSSERRVVTGCDWPWSVYWSPAEFDRVQGIRRFRRWSACCHIEPRNESATPASVKQRFQSEPENRRKTNEKYKAPPRPTPPQKNKGLAMSCACFS